MKGMGAISDVAATAAKCSGTPRGMHAPRMVDACSRTARHPPSREMTGVGNCGCKNAGGQKYGRRIRPSGTVAAVGRSKLQHWRRCSRHGRRPSSRERKGIGLGGCKNRHAVGLAVGKANCGPAAILRANRRALTSSPPALRGLTPTHHRSWGRCPPPAGCQGSCAWHRGPPRRMPGPPGRPCPTPWPARPARPAPAAAAGWSPEGVGRAHQFSVGGRVGRARRFSPRTEGHERLTPNRRGVTACCSTP